MSFVDLRTASDRQLATLRSRLVTGSSTSVEAFAQEFAGCLFTSFSTVVLSRV